MSTANPISPKIGSASLTSRQVFDISPGQVWSLREEPLISRMRGVSLAVVVAPLRGEDSVARGQPVDRDFVIRIGKTRSRLARYRRLARIAVAVPCRADDGVEFALQRLERGIGEAAAISFFEFLARQFDGWHSLADIGLRPSENSLNKITEANAAAGFQRRSPQPCSIKR